MPSTWLCPRDCHAHANSQTCSGPTGHHPRELFRLKYWGSPAEGSDVSGPCKAAGQDHPGNGQEGAQLGKLNQCNPYKGLAAN